MTDTDSYHYGVVARAIALIDAAPRPLTLAELADEMRDEPHAFPARVLPQWGRGKPETLTSNT